MNKNTSLEERMKEDQIASIGIGAMIVFIALILVAAVASVVIIQTVKNCNKTHSKLGRIHKKKLVVKSTLSLSGSEINLIAMVMAMVILDTTK